MVMESQREVQQQTTIQANQIRLSFSALSTITLRLGDRTAVSFVGTRGVISLLCPGSCALSYGEKIAVSVRSQRRSGQ
jgi:hypothetical protein